MDPQAILKLLLGVAVLVPLISFGAIFLAGPHMGRHGSGAGILATCAIIFSFLLSLISAGVWLWANPLAGAHGSGEHHDAHQAESKHAAIDSPLTPVALTEKSAPHTEHDDPKPGEKSEKKAPHHGGNPPPPYYTGVYWVLGDFGDLEINISYYIDALTITMFCMVTLIASCIHVYAQGYMSDELTDDYVDHEVPAPEHHGHGHGDHGHADHSHGHAPAVHATTAHGHGDHAHDDGAHGHDDHGHGHGHDDGAHLHRPGRYHRFFQYMSLFCFSMLGLVLAGNIAMVFVFWELVGICSYFLIGFYVERESASTAANKAFIMNRVGDFGMIIGLFALWTGCGTFAFGDTLDAKGKITKAGIFSQVRPESNDYKLMVPDGMVRSAAGDKIAAIVRENSNLTNTEIEAKIAKSVVVWRVDGYGYWLLVVAGIGIFCGCVGKSAQFPLQTWLPDAMEGPTPVSGLVHSATMVAAGVTSSPRFYPVFAPEALLTIATVGAITLFIAATIAITAVDIKRVLAYSTISQLGYMMLALGLGGWVAGVMHLITHAFFKSLLFLCSGSVIHSVHTNDMTKMGGLRQKMPITAITMLIGCLAIAGAGIPLVIGLSGYYSKDAILEQALSLWSTSGSDGGSSLNRILGAVFFCAAAGGAAITAFYMFRLYFLTFEGTPRDEGKYDHAHESPVAMYGPLVVLAFFAVVVAWPYDDFTFGLTKLSLANMIESGRPVGTQATQDFAELPRTVSMTWPDEHLSHAPLIKTSATMLAFFTALGGIALAAVFYLWNVLDPEDVRRGFPSAYRFLVNKWYFDEIYDLLFIQPTLFVGRLFASIDRDLIDAWIVDMSARVVKTFSIVWEFIADQLIVDGTVNGLASWTWSLGTTLRDLQTGYIRQYVLFIVVGMVALFIFISFFWSISLAG